MSKKTWLLAATGLVAVAMYSPVLASQAMAQTTDAGTAATTDTKTDTKKKAELTTAADSSNVVVVVRGIRGSNKDSADKKRKSKQISDSVSAEDAGKLPDNNAAEALAHVTGVQITRSHGEGQDLAIRGIQEVGTTVNGNALGGGNLRSLNHNSENGAICTIAMIAGQCQDQGPTLSDVPAALIKSVTVYKTRTADQVEGGVGGVVNIELRRPLDLPKGLTVAGSYRLSMASIGNTQSPYSSLLVADRFDTPIGEMGFLANFGYEKNRYQENHLVTETVFPAYGGTDGDDGTLMCLHAPQGVTNSCATDTNPAVKPYFFTSYRVWDGVQKGTNSRPTANLAYQWKPTDNLDFLLEGTWFGSRELGENDYMSLKTAGDASPIFSNIVLQPDGTTIRSMTVTPSGANSYPLELLSSYWQNKSDTYTTNFETHYHNGKWQINGTLQYNWTNITSENLYTDIYVKNFGSAKVDFDDPKANGPTVTLANNAALSDISNYLMNSLHNQVDNTGSRDFNGQFDVTYTVSDTFPIRSIQFGARESSHFMHVFTAYRDGFPAVAITDFPTGNNLISANLETPGFSTSSFYHLDNKALLNDWPAVLNYMQGTTDANGNVLTPAHKNDGDDWSTYYPSDKDNNSYREKEFSQAWYGQVNYAFNAFFPIDGVLGVRVVDTQGESASTAFKAGYAKVDGNGNPVLDSSGNQIIVPDTRSNSISPGKYQDVLPSYNATIHFMSNLQLRLAYTYSVQRPAFSQLSGGVHLSYDGSGKATSGWGGNPELKPEHGPNYDASLEYYFGRGGIVSFAAYLKKPENQFFAYRTTVTFPDLGVTTPIPFDSTYNAGAGTFQGYEFNAQGFFDFLPSFWKNFGGGFNFTYNQIYKLSYPTDLVAAAYPTSDNVPWTSKETYNIQLYYDTPMFNARIAYNYRSKFMSDINAQFPQYTYINAATSRLDASFSYTPVKSWTFTLEGTNLLNNNQVGYYGYRYFPAETRLQARTIQVGARFRY